MGDVGDDMRALRANGTNQRSQSHAAGLRDADAARAAAAAAGLELTISNDGHHWQFRRAAISGRPLILSFWPASAKAMRAAPSRGTFRCRGWKHALAVAARLSRGVE